MLSAEALTLRGNEDAGGAAPADDQSRLGCGRHPRQQRRNLARWDRQEDPARRHVSRCRDPLPRAPQALQLHHRQDRQGCCLRGRQSPPSHRQAKGVQGNVRELLIQGTFYTMGAWHSSHTSQVTSYLLTALLCSAPFFFACFNGWLKKLVGPLKRKDLLKTEPVILSGDLKSALWVILHACLARIFKRYKVMPRGTAIWSPVADRKAEAIHRLMMIYQGTPILLCLSPLPSSFFLADRPRSLRLPRSFSSQSVTGFSWETTVRETSSAASSSRRDQGDAPASA